MKYDLKAMNYEQGKSLATSFYWGKTPEGHNYWREVDSRGKPYPPEAQAKLDAMEKQWQQENGTDG